MWKQRVRFRVSVLAAGGGISDTVPAVVALDWLRSSQALSLSQLHQVLLSPPQYHVLPTMRHIPVCRGCLVCVVFVSLFVLFVSLPCSRVVVCAFFLSVCWEDARVSVPLCLCL